MSDIFPASIQITGTIRAQVVMTIAAPALPTLAEINAASSLDISPYIMRSALAITNDQEVVDDTRLSDSTLRQALGIASEDIDKLRYVVNPQAAAAALGNKAYDKLIPGLNCYLVLRFGSKTLLSGAAFASGQFIEVHQMQCGDQFKITGGEDNAVHTIEQRVTLNRVIEKVAIPV